MVKIEKGIPIPLKKRGVTPMLRVLMQMEPGDSVLLKKSSADYLANLGRQRDRNMVTRSEGDRKRVWFVG
jgi:hypothetical protein